MADLDSFFAKKDKKKTKKGKKFTTTDEIAKRLEDTEKKSEKSILAAATEQAKREEQIQAEANSKNGHAEGAPAIAEPVKEQKPEEEQWNDFKDEATIDVSDLKITKLNIEEEEDGKGDNDDMGADSDQDKKEGVWKVEEAPKSIQATICEAVDSDNLENVKATVAAMANNSRWNSKEMAPSPLPRGSGAAVQLGRRKKAAPDINNAESFPTLSGKPSHPNRRNNKNFHNPSQSTNNQSSNMSSSGSMQSNTSGVYRPPMFRSANKFDALTDHSNKNY